MRLFSSLVLSCVLTLVASAATPPVSTAPSIKISDRVVILSVDLASGPDPTAKIQWYRNTRSITNGIYWSYKVKFRDVGDYYAVVKNAAGSTRSGTVHIGVAKGQKPDLVVITKG